MRNLKKLLALALVLVMTLALVPMASAADFTDAEKIVNKDAVELLVTLGVIKGYDDGSFDPEGSLTRAEAAKIIYAATRGFDDGATIFTGTQLFTDVVRGHWAEGYINYAAAMDFVSGHGNGIFEPDGKVTGYQFLKMLLCALGYDATIEKFIGTTTWEYNALTAALRAGLTEGFEGSLGDALTRDNMARITANMINAYTVRYNEGKAQETSRTFGEEKLGLVAITGILVANELATIDEVNPAENGAIVKIGDKFVGIPASADLDMLGKEVTVLVSVKSGKTLVDAAGNYDSNAIDKTFGGMKETANNKIVEINDKAKYEDSATYFINFEAVEKDDALALNDEAGHTVVAISNDGDNNIDIIIAIEYSFDKVAAVSSKGVVSLAGNKLDDENAMGIEDLEAGDMVVWYQIHDGKFIVERPDVMEGKATGYTSTYVVIGGKRYAPATGISNFVTTDAPLSKDATWYLFNDMILGCTETGEELVKSYALVTRSTSIGWEYRVEIFTDGGETAVYSLANPDDVVESNAVPFGLYTYSINEDGQIELEVADIAGNEESGEFSYAQGYNRILGKLINSKTIVFAQIEDKWVIYTGINKIPSLAGDEASRIVMSVAASLFSDNDGLAVVVLPNVELADTAPAEQHFIVLSDVVYIGESKYTFKAWNGTEIADYTSTTSVEQGGIYTFGFASNGNVNKADAVSGTEGYLTHAADYTLRLGTAGSEDGTLYTYNDKTVVFEVDVEAGEVEKTAFDKMSLIPADQVVDQEAASFDSIVVTDNGVVTVVYKFVG